MSETNMQLMYLAPSWFQMLIVVGLIVLLFGRGKISDLMGDVAKGIKSFKKGLSDEEEVRADIAKSLENSAQGKPASTVHTGTETKAG
ncbi:MAG: twin-arginine translocase TatA/TatE family subunit [Hyphomicrobiales bacterium]|nr:twin-arginine translocase TatA/TatE family subunit [Hyphomicrobiales bacterium]